MSSNIFERLQNAKNEAKLSETIQLEINNLNIELEEIKDNFSLLVVKHEQVQDILSGKARSEELHSLRVKVSKDLEEMRGLINGSDVEKRLTENMEKKYVLRDEYEKEVEDLKMALEAYVKNQPVLLNRDYEARLKKLEDMRRVPVSVNRNFK